MDYLRNEAPSESCPSTIWRRIEPQLVARRELSGPAHRRPRAWMAAAVGACLALLATGVRLSEPGREPDAPPPAPELASTGPSTASVSWVDDPAGASTERVWSALRRASDWKARP